MRNYKSTAFLWANITEILCEINGKMTDEKKTIWRKKTENRAADVMRVKR